MPHQSWPGANRRGLLAEWPQPLRSCRPDECLEWQQRVGSSSWQDGEAAVRRRLTLERQVTSTLLPDCAIKALAAEADLCDLTFRRVPESSSRPSRC